MITQAPEVLYDVHECLSWYEMPGRLPAAALAGEACVWCTRPADATAVELAPSAALRRLACQRCYAARLAWYLTWADWHTHFTACTACQQRQTCYVAHGHRLLHEQTAQAIGKTPECLVCPAPLLATELVAPLCWEGNTRFNVGYAHLRCLTARASTR
ncbi:hypothetical protein ACH4JS_04140 [Streptomyces sp. NPDC017638]|uniref:hypothetical protein n=1 Tax=Streptomyces sp. NPDC017638 TaxID=3365004 RepID=UPI00379CD00D